MLLPTLDVSKSLATMIAEVSEFLAGRFKAEPPLKNPNPFPLRGVVRKPDAGPMGASAEFHLQPNLDFSTLIPKRCSKRIVFLCSQLN